MLGTIQNVGTEIMTIADLNEMEARVDIGENDVVRIAPGQKARLEVDAFKKRKFNGTVTEIANSSKDAGQMSAGSSQEATKFEVRIRIQEKEAFRPGMSVTAEIETCYRTNALTVPFASVTTRPPKEKEKKGDAKLAALADPPRTNSPKSGANALATKSGPLRPKPMRWQSATNAPAADGTNVAKSDKKSKEAVKQVEVVFVLEGDHAKMVAGEDRHQRRQLLGNHRRPHRRAGSGFRQLQGHHPGTGGRQEDPQRPGDRRTRRRRGEKKE